MRTVRIFISSPGDVMHERLRVHRVIERLNGEYATVARFEAVRWETRFYSAHASFQEAIPEARDCDVVIGILWSRLGTALPETFPAMPAEFAQAPDERYPSGTAYELLSSTFARKARAAAGEGGKPDVYVFRKSAPAVIKLGNPEEVTEAQDQWNRLEAFFNRWFLGPGGAIRAAFHPFDTTDEFERSAEALLRAWIKENLEGAAAVVWPATMGSPFRGLASFDATHAAVFFGRDRKVGRAIEVLKDAAAAAAAAGTPPEPGVRDRQARPFLLIVGPSGSGKSSLMRAGLAPRLTAPGVVPAVDVWRTAALRPTDAPSAFEALAAALTRDGTTSDHGGFGPALPELAQAPGGAPELAQLLSDSPAEAAGRVAAALDAVAEGERHREGYERRLAASLLLLVDQLEDIFSSDVGDDQRAGFANALAALAATGRVWVVATLRGDLYERLISDRPWIALKDSGATYDLAPPGPEELEEIVRKSAAAAGLQYEADPATAKRLDEQLLADASGQDILPLLQFTLNRLYDERETAGGATWLTYRAYRALGGLDGAIDQAAEQALAPLSADEIEALPRLLRLLAVPVDSRGGAGTRAALTVRAVRSAAVKRDAASAKLADALVGARILLASRDENNEGALLSVAHQRVFQSWQRAQKIIADQQDFYRIRDDVEKQHQRWLGGGQSRQLLIPPGVAIAEAEKVAGGYRDELPEQLLTFIGASGRRARWRQRALLAATVVFAVVAAIAAWQRNVATKAQMSAEANYLTARGTIDGIIKSFAGRLSQMQGVTVDTVEAAFNEINRSVEDLGARAATSDPTFDKTRADLAYEFARTYKKAESPRAVQVAENGLHLLEALADKFPHNPDYRLAISNSHELLSDLLRTSAPRRSWEANEKALTLRRELNAARPGNPTVAESLTKSLIRAGDLEAQVNRDFATAARRYDEALDLSLYWFRRREDDAAWQRELSWALSKVGDQKSRGAPSAQAEALAFFEQELCLRRRLYEGDSSNTLIQSDVSWSLERVGRARQRQGDFALAAEAFTESIGLRRTLLEHDRNNEVWLRDLYVIVTRYGLLQLKTRAGDAGFVYLTEAQQLHKALAERNALQNWLPDFGPGLEKARALLGEDADGLLSALHAAVRQKENISVRQFLVKRPTSAECWPKLTSDLAALAAARGLAPAGSP